MEKDFQKRLNERLKVKKNNQNFALNFLAEVNETETTAAAAAQKHIQTGDKPFDRKDAVRRSYT